MESIVLQSHLGKTKSITRKDQNMQGVLALATITKIYHKNNTVDVKLVRSNNRIRSSDRNEGRFSCRVLCTNSGYDKRNQIAWGVIEPLSIGQLVVVSFLDGYKSEPIVLMTMHYIDNINNILPNRFPLDPTNSFDDLKNGNKYLRVFPLQDYFRLDGYGDIEFSLHTKSFISWSERVNDKSSKLGGTDFKDLSEKNKQTGQTLCLPSNYTDTYQGEYDTYTRPKDLLLVLRDDVDDALTTWTKIYANMSDKEQSGLIRITREPNNGTLSYMQMNKKGEIKLRRQLDSINVDKGNNFSEIIMTETGNVIIRRGKSLIKITDSEISISSEKVSINGIDFSRHKHTCPVSEKDTSEPY